MKTFKLLCMFTFALCVNIFGAGMGGVEKFENEKLIEYREHDKDLIWEAMYLKESDSYSAWLKQYTGYDVSYDELPNPQAVFKRLKSAYDAQNTMILE